MPYTSNDWRCYQKETVVHVLQEDELTHSYNDWRDYVLFHSWGTKPEQKAREKEYNAKYYQEHKEEILKKRKEARRNSYVDKEGEDTGWQYSKKDGASRSWDSEKYGNGDETKKREELLRLSRENAFVESIDEYDDYMDGIDSHDEYSAEVLKNVRENNENVQNNIKNLAKTVQDYVNANADKLSTDQIAKLYEDMDNQISLERKRLIDLDSSEGQAYVNKLLKEADGKVTVARASNSKSSSNAKKTEVNKEDKEQNSTSSTSSTKAGWDVEEQRKEQLAMKKASQTSSSSNDHGLTSRKKTYGDGGGNAKKGEVVKEDATQKAIDTIKRRNANSIDDPDSPVNDFGEFLAEIGEEGGAELSGQAARDAWIEFRKSLGVDTDDRTMTYQSKVLGDRMTRNRR